MIFPLLFRENTLIGLKPFSQLSFIHAEPAFPGTPISLIYPHILSVYFSSSPLLSFLESLLNRGISVLPLLLSFFFFSVGERVL